MTYSIIIPHKNVPHLLRRCLDSIPQMQGLEIIVVDDASEPENIPASDRPDVCVILTKEGGGAGYARNVGISAASGRWLLFVDADDWVTPQFASLLHAHKEDKADMILFQADSLNEQTHLQSARHIQHNQAVMAGVNGSLTMRQAAIGITAPWCRMVNRDLVLRHNLRFDEIMVANDVMFVSKAVCLSQIILFDPGVLYVVTERQESLIHSHYADASRYFMRMDVLARANKLWLSYGLRPLPLVRMVWQARRQHLFFEALAHALRHGILFSGVTNYLYLIKKKTTTLLYSKFDTI